MSIVIKSFLVRNRKDFFMMNVYLSEYIAPSARKRLEQECTIVDNFDHPEELDGIIVRRTEVTEEIIRRAEHLKIISMHGVGLDTIDVRAAQRYGVRVTNVPRASSESVAELAVSLMLACSRKLKFIDRGLRKGEFHHFGESELIGNEIFGKKVGLIGSGNIAQRVAAILKNAFSCKIFCYNPRQTSEKLALEGMKKIGSLEEMFRLCDVVSIHVPLTKDTKNMVSRSVLEQANPGLILVNTARGGIVDESALYDCLSSGRIRAAGMDVFEEEIPNRNDPLLHLDNFIGTLHVGGSTKEALERVSNEAVDNLLAGLHDEDVRCVWAS